MFGKFYFFILRIFFFQFTKVACYEKMFWSIISGEGLTF